MPFGKLKAAMQARRRKRLGKNGHDKMQYFQFEEKRARDQAHIITQGSGEAPYVPYWMGKNWARPLTLFYRIAYRITDTVAKNVIKPTLEFELTLYFGSIFIEYIFKKEIYHKVINIH